MKFKIEVRISLIIKKTFEENIMEIKVVKSLNSYLSNQKNSN